jgi:TnpA family transposase
LRPLLLLDLFAEGTNTGVKRVAKANHQYSYGELLYVRKHDLSVEALRHANAAVLNTILARRNPQLWGDGHACASDGRRFESWSQNLMTEWRSRYRGYGVLVYWYVETNAVCIYSQLRNFSFSEVAAMIEGLIRHDTEMGVEKNFVDSRGQSEGHCQLNGSICQTGLSSGTLNVFQGYFMTRSGMSALRKCPPEPRSGRGFTAHPLS